MRGLLLSLVALGLVATPALAGAPAGRPRLDTWDAAYLPGGRAGYIHTFTEEVMRDGQKALRTTVELRLTVKRFDDTVQLSMDTGNIETAAGKITGVFMRQFLGKTKQTDIIGTVVGKELKLTLDGTKSLKPAPWNDKVVSLYRQQTLFKDREIKPGDEFDYPSFEPSINLVLKTHVVVKEFEEVEMFHGRQKHRLLRVESRPERVESVQLPSLVTWLDPNLEVARSEVEIPGLGNIILYRTTKEDALIPATAGSTSDIAQLIPLKQKIARPYDSAAATYRIQIRDDEDPVSTFAKDSRQSVTKIDSRTIELIVRAASGPGIKSETEAPAAEFLQSSYFINCDDAKVKSLARQAVGTETDSWKKAVRVEKWVHDHMVSRNHEALATADHVAKTLQGDCTEYAMLTAAMCRAEGVPSRTAVGLVYADVKGNPTFAFHMWTEVWARGEWQSLDATLGKGYVGATHLKISAQSWHDTRTMTPLFPVVRLLGRVGIEVVDVRGR